MLLDTANIHAKLVVDGLMLFYFILDYSYLILTNTRTLGKKKIRKPKQRRHNSRVKKHFTNYKNVAWDA